MPSTMKPFHQDCTTLFVGDLIFDRAAPDAVGERSAFIGREIQTVGILDQKLDQNNFHRKSQGLCHVSPFWGCFGNVRIPPSSLGGEVVKVWWWEILGAKARPLKLATKAPWKISLWPQKERIIDSNSNHPFFSCKLAVSFREGYVSVIFFQISTRSIGAESKTAHRISQKTHLQDVTPGERIAQQSLASEGLGNQCLGSL